MIDYKEVSNINHLELYINKKVNERISEISSQMNRVNIENNTLRKSILNKDVNIVDKIGELENRLMEELKPKSNYDKGIVGEEYIEKYLTENFHTGYTVNTRIEKGGGDLIFNYADLVYMIESKNHEYVTGIEVNKFLKNVEEGCKNGSFNIAIFISLRSTIAKKNTFDFEIVTHNGNNIVVLYLSNVNEYSRLISAAVNIGKVIYLNLRNNGNQTEELIKRIQSLRFNVDTLLKSIRSQKKTIKSLITDMEQNEFICKQLINDSIDSLKGNEEDMVSKTLEEKVLGLYRTILKEKKVVTSADYKSICKDNSVTERDINKYGLRLRAVEKIYKLRTGREI